MWFMFFAKYWPWNERTSAVNSSEENKYVWKNRSSSIFFPRKLLAARFSCLL